MKLTSAGAYRVMPWRNGGGSTTEIAVSPAGASLETFEWRLSMATVERDGPFSTFPGIDRTLTLLDGARMDLTLAQRDTVVLTPAAPTLAFTGEAEVHAAVPAGPITDFNVMTRRAHCGHRFTRLALDGDGDLAMGAGTTVLFLAEGATLRVGGGAGAAATLGRRDSLTVDPTIDPGASTLLLSCTAPAVLFVVEILSPAG